MTVSDVRTNPVVKKTLTFNMILRRLSLETFFFTHVQTRYTTEIESFKS